MSTFPLGTYTCAFDSQSYLVTDSSGDTVAEIAVDYSTEFVSVKLNVGLWVIGTDDLDNIEKDGFTEKHSVELAGSNIEDTMYFVSVVGDSNLEFPMLDLGELRFKKDGGTLHIFTNQ